MAKYALYVSLKAKPGKAAEVEAFLKQGAEMSRAETGTVTWYGIKEDDGAYAVFDTFDDEAGRDAHLNGAIAKALMAKAEELFSNTLQIHKIQIIAEQIKPPGSQNAWRLRISRVMVSTIIRRSNHIDQFSM